MSLIFFPFQLRNHYFFFFDVFLFLYFFEKLRKTKFALLGRSTIETNLKFSEAVVTEEKPYCVESGRSFHYKIIKKMNKFLLNFLLLKLRKVIIFVFFYFERDFIVYVDLDLLGSIDLVSNILQKLVLFLSHLVSLFFGVLFFDWFFFEIFKVRKFLLDLLDIFWTEVVLFDCLKNVFRNDFHFFPVQSVVVGGFCQIMDILSCEIVQAVEEFVGIFSFSNYSGL